MLRIGDSDVETFMLVTLCLWSTKDGGDRILFNNLLESIKYTVVAFCRLESQEYFLLFYAFISASFCTSNVRQWNFQPEMEVI